MTVQDIDLNRAALSALARIERIEAARTLECAKRVTLALLTLKWGDK